MKAIFISLITIFGFHAYAANPVDQVTCEYHYLANNQGEQYLVYNTYGISISEHLAYEHFGEYSSETIHGELLSSQEIPGVLNATFKFLDLHGESTTNLQVNLNTGNVERVTMESGHVLKIPYFRKSNMAGIITQPGGRNVQVQCSAVKLDRKSW